MGHSLFRRRKNVDRDASHRSAAQGSPTEQAAQTKRQESHSEGATSRATAKADPIKALRVERDGASAPTGRENPKDAGGSDPSGKGSHPGQGGNTINQPRRTGDQPPEPDTLSQRQADQVGSTKGISDTIASDQIAGASASRSVDAPTAAPGPADEFRSQHDQEPRNMRSDEYVAPDGHAPLAEGESQAFAQTDQIDHERTGGALPTGESTRESSHTDDSSHVASATEPDDIEEIIGDEPAVVTENSSSSKDFFEPATNVVDKYGIDGLLQPREQADSVERALADLGTPIPVIRHVAEVGRVTRGSWVAAARDLGTPPGERLTRSLSMATGYPFFPRTLVDDVDATHLHDVLPRGVHSGRFAGLPCARNGNDLLIVVADTDSISEVRTDYFGSNMRLEFCIGSPATIETLYRKKYGDTARPLDKALAQGDDPAEIIRYLLIHAGAVGASDIHLEPRKNHGVIYLRIDGVRETFRVLPLTRADQSTTSGAVGGVFGQLTNLIFHNSGQSDVEMTEEGEIDALIPPELQGRFDFRLQLSKSINGVRAVIRLLDQSGDVGEVEDLGIDSKTAEKLDRVTHADSGLLLFTGPTGSGKSTTQAALLKSINAVQNSIQTIENPVETRSGMWVQHPLSRRGDRDEGSLQKELAKGLLRCDPEVIQVQELRDADNTMVAADAANTGHLVFATLHTNSAALSIVRLRSMRSPMTGEALDMSVIAPVLRGIMAQRLVRKVCRHCRVIDERPATLDTLRESFGDPGTVYAASTRGCESCRFTGYSGRMSIYELLEVTREVSDLLVRNPSVTDLTELLPFTERMIGRGYERVIAGKTTMAEVHRVVSER